jgi:hypothetical protein
VIEPEILAKKPLPVAEVPMARLLLLSSYTRRLTTEMSPPETVPPPAAKMLLEIMEARALTDVKAKTQNTAVPAAHRYRKR